MSQHSSRFTALRTRTTLKSTSGLSLMHAVANDSTWLVKLLLADERVTLDYGQRLWWATSSWLHRSGRFVSRGEGSAPITATTRNRVPSPLAVRSGFYVVIERLLAAGVEMNLRDGDGMAQLHVMPRMRLSGEPRFDGIVRQLVAAGADINAEDRKGKGPPTIAVRGAHVFPTGAPMFREASDHLDRERTAWVVTEWSTNNGLSPRGRIEGVTRGRAP